MQVQAKLGNVRLAPRRGRLVANMIRNKMCAEALKILQAVPRGAARPIEKLVRSALANAQEHNERHQAGLDLDNLYIKKITVDEGPRMWRIRARAMGRAAWLGKMTSHITVVLDER